MKLPKLNRLFVGFSLAIFCLCSAAAERQAGGDRVKPGAEYKDGTKKRTFADIAIEDLKEGSLESAFFNSMRTKWNRDFAAMEKYATPAMVWTATHESEEHSKLMLELNSLTKPLRVGDTGIDGDVAYAYIGLRVIDGDGAKMGYHYFIKKDGWWYLALETEWKKGKMLPKPKS